MLSQHSFIEKTLGGIEGFFHVFQTAESFSQRRGLLQTLDPRIKLLTFIVTLVSATLTHHIQPLLILYSAALLLALLSRLPLGSFLLRTWIFVPLFTAVMIFPVIFNTVTPGAVLVHLKPIGPLDLTITVPGIYLAGLLVLRVATAVSWSLLLLWTTPWHRLLNALNILQIPEALVFTLAMTVRYLVLLVRQVEDAHTAIQSRTLYSLKRKQGHAAVTGTLVTTLRKSIQASEDTFGAMVSRGFTGRIALLEAAHLRRRDYLWLTLWAGGLFCFWMRGR